MKGVVVVFMNFFFLNCCFLADSKILTTLVILFCWYRIAFTCFFVTGMTGLFIVYSKIITIIYKAD